MGGFAEETKPILSDILSDQALFEAFAPVAF
jgi:hypothetical protein